MSIRKGDYDVYVSRIDGTGERPMLTDDYDQVPLAWDRTSARLVVLEWHHDGSKPIALVDTSHGGTRDELVDGKLHAYRGARLSPDDRWLAFVVEQTARTEVYVQPFPGSGRARRISSRGGTEPVWSPAAKELFYRRDDELIAVGYRDDNGQFVAGDERVIVKLPPAKLAGVTPDGRRFLIARAVEPEPPPGVRVVLNWLDEIKDKAAAR